MNNIRFKLAMGQMLVEGGARDENLRRAAGMVEDAAAQGCRIVVLPECLDAGWAHPEARRLAEPIPGPAQGSPGCSGPEGGHLRRSRFDRARRRANLQ